MELILGKSKAKLQLEATLKQIEVLEHSVDQQMEILLPIYTRMKGVMTDAGTGSRTALAPRRGTQKFKLPPKVANSDSLSMNMRTMNRLLKRYKQSGENGHSVSELGAMYLQAISMVLINFPSVLPLGTVLQWGVAGATFYGVPPATTFRKAKVSTPGSNPPSLPLTVNSFMLAGQSSLPHLAPYLPSGRLDLNDKCEYHLVQVIFEKDITPAAVSYYDYCGSHTSKIF
uniref:SUN domain-containing protein n=1 Tax=Angiostrongylus cantonensis TaxID=6313 RepID=A0A0K0D248_ANGCA